MKPYGLTKYYGYTFVEGHSVFSRSKSGRGNGKNNAAQKRTDRAMKKRGRRENKNI